MKRRTWKRKVMALAMCSLMGVMAVGCGNSSSGGETKEADDATEESAEQDSAAEEDSATEESSGDTYKVGYVNLADSDVNCRITKEYFEEYAAKYPELEVTYYDSENDINKEISNMETAVASGVDAIVVLPLDSDALVPVTTDAIASGIDVIGFRGTINNDDTIYVGSENYESGHMQGEYLAEVLPENAKVLYMMGTAGMDPAIKRQEGIHDALEEAGRTDVEFLAEQDADFDKAEGMQLMEDWIQTFPEFDAVAAANDQMALGAMEALKAANRLDGVMILGVDGVEEALDAVESGDMAMTVFQNCNAQADACTQVLDKLAKGEEVEDFLVPYEIVTKDNVAEYK